MTKINKNIAKVLDPQAEMDEVLDFLPEEIRPLLEAAPKVRAVLLQIFAFGCAHGADILMEKVPQLLKEENIPENQASQFAGACFGYVLDEIKKRCIADIEKDGDLMFDGEGTATLGKHHKIKLEPEDILGERIKGVPKKVAEGIAEEIVTSIMSVTKLKRGEAIAEAMKKLDDGEILMASPRDIEKFGGEEKFKEVIMKAKSRDDLPETMQEVADVYDAVKQVLTWWGADKDDGKVVPLH